MRTLAVVIAVLWLAAACGGSSSGSTPVTPLPDLDSGFTGTWNGTTTLTFEGNPPSSAAGRLIVTVSGQQATVADVCPDGSATIVASGTGARATWGTNSGLACPPVVFTNCAAVTLTYFSAILTLGGNTLTAQGIGSASGCGLTLRLTTTFVGTK